MKELVEAVESLTKEELVRASQEHGCVNHSSHESYSILREEVDEAHDESVGVEVFTDRYWKSVKADDEPEQEANLLAVYQKATLAASEYIQTAAMAIKALRTLKGGN